MLQGDLLFEKSFHLVVLAFELFSQVDDDLVFLIYGLVQIPCQSYDAAVAIA